MEPSLAGPRRPQDRVPLRSAKPMFEAALAETLDKTGVGASAAVAARVHAVSASPELSNAVLPAVGEEQHGGAQVTMNGETFTLDHGSVVIAAITSSRTLNRASCSARAVAQKASLGVRQAGAKELRAG